MEELQKMLKQIEDYKTYKKYPEGSEDQYLHGEYDGWDNAFHVMETWVKSRMSEIYRNSDKRPY